MRNVDESIYWTPNKILSYNAMFNFVVGSRGTGKTTGALIYCVKRFIKKKRGFLYIRRYETNFSKKEKMLSVVSKMFPSYEFNVDGMRLKIRKAGKDHEWDIMGYLVPLSTSLNDKSIPFDDIDTMIYDEFIISKGMQTYIPNEVELFLDYYNTVDRLNDRVKVFFLANAVSIVNPYFIYFNLSPRMNDKIRTRRNGYVAVEVVMSREFQEAADKTRFGQFIKGTAYYDYAIGNEFADDNDLFIDNPPSTAFCHSVFKFDGESLAFYMDSASGNGFFTSKIPKGHKIIALTRDDMQPNLIMLERASNILKTINRFYQQGSLYFNNVVTRDLYARICAYFSIK